MGVVQDLIQMFDATAAKRQAAETAEAQQAKIELESLREHPGWIRLTSAFTSAGKHLYSRWARGDAITEREQGYAQFLLAMEAGPQQLLEDVLAVLEQARMDAPLRRG